jgi:hypothetical protein
LIRRMETEIADILCVTRSQSNGRELQRQRNE